MVPAGTLVARLFSRRKEPKRPPEPPGRLGVILWQEIVEGRYRVAHATRPRKQVRRVHAEHDREPRQGAQRGLLPPPLDPVEAHRRDPRSLRQLRLGEVSGDA